MSMPRSQLILPMRSVWLNHFSLATKGANGHGKDIYQRQDTKDH